MEQNSGQSAGTDANDIIRSSAQFTRNFNVTPPPASNQPQGHNQVATPFMYMPYNGFWPTGAAVASQGGMWATNTMWTNPYNFTTGACYMVERMVATNYAYHNACFASFQSFMGGVNDPRWSMQQVDWGYLQSRIPSEEWPKYKRLFESLLRGDLRGAILAFRDDSNNLASDQNGGSRRGSIQVTELPAVTASEDHDQNGDSRRGSIQVTELPAVTASDNGPPEVIPSKAVVSSDTVANHEAGPSTIVSSGPNGGGSTKLFGQSLKSTGECVTNENPKASDKRRHKSRKNPTARNEKNPTAEVDDTPPPSQPHPQDQKAPDLPYSGINMREWLEAKCFNASKRDRLCLFRKIVQMVGVQHSQGIALVELRPSSFVIFRNGDVKYIGTLMEAELWNPNDQDNTKKRGLELDFFAQENLREKMQKTSNECSLENVDMGSICNAPSVSIYEETSNRSSWLTSRVLLEKKWYAFPEKFRIRSLLSLNIYSLGLMLFELLCHFDTIEEHTTAMADLHRRILPPRFISESPQEAGLCLLLLHPEPSSCPKTREILQCDMIPDSDSTNPSNDEASYSEMINDVESEVLHDFLVSLKNRLQDRACKLAEGLKLLNLDLEEIKGRQTSAGKSLDAIGGGSEGSSTSRMNAHRDKLLRKVTELEDIYFSLRSSPEFTEKPGMDRPDKDILTTREGLPWVQDPKNLPTVEENTVDRVGAFFEGLCKFARYNKFEVCGTLKNCDLLNSNNVVSSLGFDREGQYMAAAGVSNKIKIFEFDSLLDVGVDVHYPVLELSSDSKFSCVCWNSYIRNYMVSSDYGGLVQTWDVSSGQEVGKYNEHQKRAWTVDFSRVDPTNFASGSDDCCLKIWNINERKSISTIWNPSNVCCVQYSPYSSHLVAFGSADYRVRCFDLRHTKIPWCTLSGHNNGVSFVRFLDSETIVSSSTDNTLMLWDLKKTNLRGTSPNACTLTYKGHVNEKHFVGLAVSDGYIACGSESNEVYAYHRSLPMPLASHKFGHIDPLSGEENTKKESDEYFVSSVCWRKNSQMLVAANSKGNMKVLRMA